MRSCVRPSTAEGSGAVRPLRRTPSSYGFMPNRGGSAATAIVERSFSFVSGPGQGYERDCSGTFRNVSGPVRFLIHPASSEARRRPLGRQSHTISRRYQPAAGRAPTEDTNHDFGSGPPLQTASYRCTGGAGDQVLRTLSRTPPKLIVPETLRYRACPPTSEQIRTTRRQRSVDERFAHGDGRLDRSSGWRREGASARTSGGTHGLSPKNESSHQTTFIPSTRSWFTNHESRPFLHPALYKATPGAGVRPRSFGRADNNARRLNT